MGKLLQEAIFYRKHNIVPIPLHPCSKLPYFHWKYWCDKKPRMLELANWFDCDDKNIGIICGGKENLVVIDFDSKDMYRWWELKCSHDIVWRKVLEDGYKVSTSRGVHVYVKTADRVESRKLKRGFDIKSHNSYVLVPPSHHPDGTQYAKLCEFNLYTIDDLNDFLEVPPIEIPVKQVLDDVWDADIIIQRECSVIESIKQGYPVERYVSKISRVESVSPDGRFYWHRCISPYHEDKNPSFRVDTVNNLCTCMSPACMLFDERGLDVIALHAKMNGMSNKESIQDLSVSVSV